MILAVYSSMRETSILNHSTVTSRRGWDRAALQTNACYRVEKTHLAVCRESLLAGWPSQAARRVLD